MLYNSQNGPVYMFITLFQNLCDFFIFFLQEQLIKLIKYIEQTPGTF